MSSYIVALVWRAQLTSTEKLVMLAMAESANDQGETAPHLADIMKTTGFSKRTIRGTWSDFRLVGLLDLATRSSGDVPAKYKINILLLQEMQKPLIEDNDDGESVSSHACGNAPPANSNNIIVNNINGVDVNARATGGVNRFPVANAIATVCRMDLNKNRAKIFAEAKRLGDVDPQDILRHYGRGGWWYLHDWRGKQGQRPSLGQVRTTWGQWEDTVAERDVGALWDQWHEDTYGASHEQTNDDVEF